MLNVDAVRDVLHDNLRLHMFCTAEIGYSALLSRSEGVLRCALGAGYRGRRFVRASVPIPVLVRRPGNFPEAICIPIREEQLHHSHIQMIHTWAVNGLCEGRPSNADVFMCAFRRRNCGRVEVESHFMRRAHVPCCATSRFSGRARRPFRLSQHLPASGVGRPPACRRSSKIGGASRDLEVDPGIRGWLVGGDVPASAHHRLID